jgi:hypothetical protein
MHFNALMKKNWINQKRQPYSTFFSLFCPGFLMLILVYIRTLILPTQQNSAELLSIQRPFFPVTWSAKEGVPATIETDKSVKDFFIYDNYTNETYTVLTD